MEKYIKELLNKHNLKLEAYIRTPDGGTNRSYIIYVTGSHGKKFTVKYFYSKDNAARERFVNEIENIKFIRKSLKAGHKKWIPHIYIAYKSGGNPYYIYDRVEGEPLGRFVYDYGYQWGIFKHKNFDDYIKFFDEIEGLSSSSAKLKLSRWGARHARKELQYYFEQVRGLLPSDLYDKVNALYEKHYKVISKSMVLSHRDLYPENILVQTPGSSKFTFLDWEYFGSVPLGYDAAFLYLSFWKEEYWKAKVFSHFYNKYENDKEQIKLFLVSFRFCLAVLAVRFIYQIDAYGKGKNDLESHARMSFLYDLNLALSGEILKPRNIKFLIDLRDIQKVANDYSLGEVESYEIFYASKGNTVARVDLKDGQKFIFRFYSLSRSASLIKRELMIFDRLQTNGIKTYDIIHAPNGGLYLEKEFYGKKRKIAVLSYINGRKIQKRWATPTAIMGAGQMLNKIHSQNIIHGDYSKENLLYTKSKISGVIDFEWGRFTTSREAKKHDLAKAIALWLIDTRSKKLDDRKFMIYFIRGYYGKDLDSNALSKLLDIVLDKISAERNIFLTTIDTRTSGHAGHRFDHATEMVRDLKPADIS